MAVAQGGDRRRDSLKRGEEVKGKVAEGLELGGKGKGERGKEEKALHEGPEKVKAPVWGPLRPWGEGGVGGPLRNPRPGE